MDKYLIDGHKLYWHLDRVAEWQKGNTIAPIYVEVSPVSLCNHRCIFCGIDFVRDKDVRLETPVFKKRLAEMGKLGVRSMMFAGEGEPLLHKDINLFIKTAKEAGIETSLTTNGSLATKKIWEDILPSLTWVRFSVDAGNSRDYAAVHKVSKDAFKKTLESIEEAVAIKRAHSLGVTLGIQFIIIEENLDGLEEAIETFSRIGADYFSLKPYSLHPQMVSRKSVLYTDKTLKRIQDTVDSYKGKTGMSIIFRKDAMGKYMASEMKFCHCRSLPFWGYISSRGDFYTCSVFIGDKRFKAGNIYEKEMCSIFYGAERQRSIAYAAQKMDVKKECRLNCRMARVNEFLEFLDAKPEHINFI